MLHIGIVEIGYCKSSLFCKRIIITYFMIYKVIDYNTFVHGITLQMLSLG